MFDPLIAQSANTNVPAVVWLLSGLATVVAGGVGFAGGIYYERHAVQRAVRRAKASLSGLFGMVLEKMESTQEACQLLEQFPSLTLSLDQTEQLDQVQRELLSKVTGIVDNQREELAQREQAKAEARLTPEEFAAVWKRSPEDPVFGLPDRAAFDENVTLLLEHAAAGEFESGLLLIRADKLDQLSDRLGTVGCQKLLQKMSGLICRAIRDEDLLCRFSADTFAVMMPQVDSSNGRNLAHAIRDTIRSHRFRFEESGPEVLMTASFGYTTLVPNDNPDVALNRASNALCKSQRRGRNQLHLHDGSTLIHVQAS